MPFRDAAELSHDFVRVPAAHVSAALAAGIEIPPPAPRKRVHSPSRDSELSSVDVVRRAIGSYRG